MSETEERYGEVPVRFVRRAVYRKEELERPVRQVRGAIVGPLGIWPFPLLTILLALIERLGAGRMGYGGRTRPVMKITQVIRDKEGRLQEISSWYQYE